MAQEVEHILGKDEVTSSSLVSSSTKKHTRFGCVFLMCAKFFAHICTISSKLCVEPVVCARCLFLQAIPHLRLPSAALWFILSQEPVVCARRSRILRALIAFSCRQQLIKYRLFTTKTSCFFNAFLTHLRDLFPNRAWSLSVAVLFVLIFQLEDIADFLLIHRPYGFIVQFLMINTGNGGSFVQL